MPSLIRPTAVTCPVFAIGAKGYQICLPGGACIGGQIPDLVASPSEVCAAILGQLQSGIAPLMPVFNLISCVQCIKDVLEAIPDSITSLDPTEIVQALNSCVVKIDDLASMVPQISAPIFLVQMFDLLICILQGFVTEIQNCAARLASGAILLSRSRGPNDPILQIVECSNRLVRNRLCAVNESMGPINTVVDLINLFLSLIGMDPIEPFGDAPEDIAEFAAQLQGLINTFRQIRTALGIPLTPPIPRC